MEKVYLVENGEQIGSFTLFDAAPSFDVLRAAFPAASRIVHNRLYDCWWVELDELKPPVRVE